MSLMVIAPTLDPARVACHRRPRGLTEAAARRIAAAAAAATEWLDPAGVAGDADGPPPEPRIAIDWDSLYATADGHADPRTPPRRGSREPRPPVDRR